MTPLERLERFKGSYTYGEVVKGDSYRLTYLTPLVQPDVIYDIGANVGIFALWAKHRFPEARIIAVEPEPKNVEVLREACDGLDGVTVIHAAVGKHPMYFRRGVDRGKHAFVSERPGYPEEMLAKATYMELTNVAVVSLGELFATHGGEHYFVKVDTEGAEGSLIGDKAANAVLLDAEYVTMEMHFWAMTRELIQEAYEARMRWLIGFRATHSIEMKLWKAAGMVWMTRIVKQ